MTSKEIKQLIQDGEKIDVEFKESRTALNKDVYNSVCSFNNRNGGHILLGINDKKQVVGVEEDKVEKIIKEFTTSVNNSQKINPALYLVPVPVEIDGKIVIYIRIPEGFQVCRHNGKIFDRSYEGDINITDSPELVYKIYARKQSSYFVNKVYPNFGLECLDTSIIEKARKMTSSRNQNHPWKSMSDEELLRSVNLILVDPQTNREGPTLAAILLFGKDNYIMSVLAQHKTDAIFRVENKDRYDDRDVVITNLIDSYDRLIKFGQKHLNDLFVLDGIVNVNARDIILREIISNTLAHRDYLSAFPAKIIIDDEKIVVENSNLAHGLGELDIEKFEPFPKNPSISKVFREIGLADELGSGMRNTYKYTRLYSGKDPIFEEGNIFRTIIPLKKIATQKVGGSVSQTSPNLPSKFPRKSPEEVKNVIVEIIKNDRYISRKKIGEMLGYSEKTISKYIQEIGNIRYVGRGKAGHWEINSVAQSSSNVPSNFPRKSLEEIKNDIVKIIKSDKYISRKKIGEMVGYSEKTISKYIQEIGNIRYVGRGKAGHWEIDE